MKLLSLGLSPPERRGAFDNPAIPLQQVGWEILGGFNNSDAGEIVTIETALGQSTVFSSINILATAVSSLPLQLFRKTATGRALEKVHPLSYLLTAEPCPELSTPDFITAMMTSLAAYGNCFAYLQRDANGAVIAMWPLHSRSTRAIRQSNNTLAYFTTDGGVSRTLKAADVFHVKSGISFDGLMAESPILLNRRLIGAAIAMDRYGSRFFANNATPALALTTKSKVKPEDKLRMHQDFEALQSGGNTHRVAILDQELTLEKISTENDAAQFLETKAQVRASIGAIWGIDSHRLGSEIRQTDSNVESMNRSFLTSVLMGYVTKFEAEYARKVLPHKPGQHSEFEISFNLARMLRGDTAAQSSWAVSGINAGYLCGNDARRAEGLNEAGPELDVFRNPVNYENSKELLKDSKPTAETVVPNEE